MCVCVYVLVMNFVLIGNQKTYTHTQTQKKIHHTRHSTKTFDDHHYENNNNDDLN